MRLFAARVLPSLLFGLLLLSGNACQADTLLPAAVNLQADGEQARRERLPVVLFFYSAGCPFCREVEEHYLAPLWKANATQPRMILRTVEIDRSRPIKDFTGADSDMRAFARLQGVAFVPHLRFLGPEGETLAPDLVGLATRDFYYGYLEEALNTAGEKMRRSAGR